MSAQSELIPNQENRNPVVVKKIRTTDSAHTASNTPDEMISKLTHRVRVLENKVDGFIFSSSDRLASAPANQNFYSTYNFSTQAYLDVSYAASLTSSNYITDRSQIIEEKIIEGIPIYYVMEYSALIVGSICTFSLCAWVKYATNLINPTLSTLGLIASIFLFFMGKVSRKDHS